MRRWLRFFITLALIVLIVGTAYFAGLGTSWAIAQAQGPTPTMVGGEPPEFSLFWEAWRIVEREFYGNLPTPSELVHGAIRGALNILKDPSTVLVEPKQHQLEKSDLEGSFEGIGATVEMRQGRLVIVAPIADSPAEKAGLKAGDIVLQVDDKPIPPDISVEDAVMLIRGPKGTKVKLTVMRQGQTEPLVFEIVRAKIETPTVSWKMQTDKIGYIRLILFGSLSRGELRRAISEVKKKGATGIIFDLRSNPGGYLDSAIDVASEFIKDGTIVIERDKNGHETPFGVRGSGTATDIPLVVLIDKGTASASEIVAGAIQDHGRAPLIGEKTFGKGSVQNIHELSDGSSLHVTIAHWLTPKHHEIDEKGLEPDIAVPLSDADVTAGRDPQLDRAIEYLQTGK
jgi:carboxyl-terminal processing protease